MRQIKLPGAPQELRGAVKTSDGAGVDSDIRAAHSDRNPMFIEKRVYQGSSGRICRCPSAIVSPMPRTIAHRGHSCTWKMSSSAAVARSGGTRSYRNLMMAHISCC